MAIKGVLPISQSSGIIGASPSDYFVSYTGLLLEESKHSAEMQSVYSGALADKANNDNGTDAYDKAFQMLYRMHQFDREVDNMNWLRLKKKKHTHTYIHTYIHIDRLRQRERDW